MVRDKFSAVRLSSEEKARFASVALSFGLTEAALLKRLVDGAIDPARLGGQNVLQSPQGARLSKMLVCLHPDVRTPLAERARARGLPAATYAAAVLRSHVLNLRPLPKVEMQAFQQGVVQLTIIGRNLNQLVRMATAKGNLALPGRDELALFIKVCTATVAHFKAALKANKASWEVGYEQAD
jgi:transposase-like protein